MTNEQKQELMQNGTGRYKLLISVLFGLLGFSGSFFAFRFAYGNVNINIVWSLLFPLIITLAWGRRYGLISALLGLAAFYPLVTSAYNGWACFERSLSIIIWISLIGYGVDHRLENRKYYTSLYFLQFVYSVVQLVLYFTVFSLLYRLNPPFWNPVANTTVTLVETLVLAVKNIILDMTVVAVAATLLLTPQLRRFLRLECSPYIRRNSKIILCVMLLVVLVSLIAKSCEYFLICNDCRTTRPVEPTACFLIGVSMSAVLGLILGGIMARSHASFIQTKRSLEVSERKYRLLNDDLEKRIIERTMELESFTYTVSHDLKAPLRSIEAYSKILLEDYSQNLNNDIGDALVSIGKTSGDMIALVNKLLQYSTAAGAEVKPENVDLLELVCVAFDELLHTAQDRSVELIFEGEIPVVRTDKILIRQILTNIISNAFKFTKTRDQAEITVSCRTTGTEMILCVADNGVGFDPALSGELFQIFRRLHNSEEYDGYGIGLATVRKLAQRIGGRVWLEGKPNHGASAYIALPNTKKADEQRE